MSSQLNVDTIVDKAGSGGTNVKIANNAVTVSEGGSATTNTVQGLAKCWVNFDGTGTIAARDSFNVSSLTDNGTGLYSVNFNNNFSDGNYAGVGTIGNADVSNPGALKGCAIGHTASNLSVIESSNTSSAANTDDDQISTNYHGDLA
jgi:hypothetical protein